MIIKCPDCGLEYSYGRNICHVCGDNPIFFGAMFNGERTNYKWNCVNGNECIDISMEERNMHESIIEIYPEG